MTPRGDLDDRGGRERIGERDDARMEGVIAPGRDPNGRVLQGRGVGDHVILCEVVSRRVCARVRGSCLVVCGPHRGTDRGDGRDQARMLLGEQDRAVASHRDADRPDPVWRSAEPELPAARNQLPHDHRHRVITWMGVPVQTTAVDGSKRERRQCRLVTCPGGERPRQAEAAQPAGVIAAEPVQDDAQGKLAARYVTRGIGDRVPDLSATGCGEEAPRVRRSRFRERLVRAGDRAHACQLVEHLAAGQHAASDEFQPGERRAETSAQPVGEHTAAGPSEGFHCQKYIGRRYIVTRARNGSR